MKSINESTVVVYTSSELKVLEKIMVIPMFI